MYNKRRFGFRFGIYLGHGFVASSDIDQGVGLEHVFDLVRGMFVQGAHGYGASTDSGKRRGRKKNKEKIIKFLDFGYCKTFVDVINKTLPQWAR